MTRTLVITILLFCAAPAAVAEQVQFGWRTLLEYDSEVTSQGGGQGDVFAAFGPVTKIEGEHQRFSYEIEHFSAYEKYDRLSNLDDWRHQVNARAQLWISPRVRVDFNNSFQVLPQFRNDTVDALETGGTPDDPDERLNSGQVLTNVFSTTLTTSPHPRLTTSSQLAVIYRTFDDPNLNSQDTTSTTMMNQATYRMSENHTFGSGFRFSNRDFETVVAGERTDATTRTYEAFATWGWQIDSRSTFSARAGPAWSDDTIDDQQESVPSVFPTYPTSLQNIGGTFYGFVFNPAACPPENAEPDFGGVVLTGECIPLYSQDVATGFGGIPGFPATGQPGIIGPQLDALLALRTTAPSRETAANNAANIFFAFTLDRRWNRFDVLATWIRSDSQTQSLGSNTVVDTVLLQTGYDLTERLRFTGAFRFTRRFSDVETESQLLLMSDTLQAIPEASLGAPFADVMGAPLFIAVLDTSFKQTRDSYSMRFQVSQDWGRYSSAFLGVTWRRQENDFDSQVDALDVRSATDSYLIQVGFTYRFQPMQF